MTLRHGDGPLDVVTRAQGWLPHTARAAVTRLRQRGHDVTLR